MLVGVYVREVVFLERRPSICMRAIATVKARTREPELATPIEEGFDAHHGVLLHKCVKSTKLNKGRPNKGFC